MVKPVPAVRLSVQRKKPKSDGLPVVTHESDGSVSTCKKPVPKPRRQKVRKHCPQCHIVALS